MWEGFREFKLYTADVQATLSRNEEGIKKLMSHYELQQKERTFTYAAAESLFC